MRRKRAEVEVTYQFEPSVGPAASGPAEWMRLAGWMFRFAPLGIGSTPIAESAGALSSLLRTSPPRSRRPGAVMGEAAEVRLRSIMLPDGSRLVRSYDASGRLSKITYPDGQVVEYQEQGSTVTVFPGTPLRIVYSRDTAGRLESIQYLSSEQQKINFIYEWAHHGLLRAVTYPDGAEVRFRWNRSGQLAEVTDGRSTITYEWDSSQRLAKLSCSDGVTSLHLDLSGSDVVLDWQVSGQAGTGGSVSPMGVHTVGTDGRSVSLLRWDGNRIVFSYDATGRVTAVYTGAGASFITRTQSRELASLVQPNGWRFCWCRDSRTDMEMIVGAASVTRIERDGRGRLIALRDASGSSVRYSYGWFQAAGCPRAISCAQWGKLLLQYHSYGRIKNIELVGKGQCSFRHRSDGRLDAVRLTGTSGELMEVIRLAGWLYALGGSNPSALEDSLEWYHLVR